MKRISFRWLFSIILLFFSVAFICGCQKDWVNVVIENQSSRDIDNARIRFGEYACSGGFVGRTYSKGNVDYPHPITEDAEVHWDVGNHEHQKQNVNLRGIYKKGMSGTLTFTIYDSSVKVMFTREPSQ